MAERDIFSEILNRPDIQQKFAEMEAQEAEVETRLLSQGQVAKLREHLEEQGIFTYELGNHLMNIYPDLRRDAPPGRWRFDIKSSDEVSRLGASYIVERSLDGIFDPMDRTARHLTSGNLALIDARAKNGLPVGITNLRWGVDNEGAEEYRLYLGVFGYDSDIVIGQYSPIGQLSCVSCPADPESFFHPLKEERDTTEDQLVRERSGIDDLVDVSEITAGNIRDSVVRWEERKADMPFASVRLIPSNPPQLYFGIFRGEFRNYPLPSLMKPIPGVLDGRKWRKIYDNYLGVELSDRLDMSIVENLSPEDRLLSTLFGQARVSQTLLDFGIPRTINRQAIAGLFLPESQLEETIDVMPVRMEFPAFNIKFDTLSH